MALGNGGLKGVQDSRIDGGQEQSVVRWLSVARCRTATASEIRMEGKTNPNGLKRFLSGGYKKMVPNKPIEVISHFINGLEGF